MYYLTVQQRFNPAYVSSDITPDVDRHRYCVVKLINATAPAIGDYLTKAELNAFCETDTWKVTVQ